jgi:hypothetical protein
LSSCRASSDDDSVSFLFRVRLADGSIARLRPEGLIEIDPVNRN